MRRALAAMVAVVALAGVAGACGDDDGDNEGAAPSTVTKAQLIERGNAICKTANDQFNALFETDFPTTPNKLTAFFAKATPIVDKRTADLRALPKVEGDEAEIQAIVDLSQRVGDDFRRAATDQEQGSELFAAEGGENATQFEEKAAAYGLTECAEEEEGDEEEGGEEGEEGPDPATFSAEKRSFIAAADAICGPVNAETTAIDEEVVGETFPPPLETWAQFFARITPLLTEQDGDLADLEPPAADRQQVQELFDALAEQTATLKQAQAAAQGGDEETFNRLLTETFPRFEEIDQQFADYGFAECGRETGEDE